MGKTSKRELRKIDGAAHMQSLEHVNELANSAQSDNLFIEDKQGGMKGVPKALRANIELMNSKGRVPIGKGEQAVLKKLLERPIIHKPISKKPTKPQPLFDTWSEDNKISKRKIRPVNVNFVPAVLLPHAGQSVNPEPEAYLELVTKVAAKDLPKPKETHVDTPQQTESVTEPSTAMETSASKKQPVRKTIADRNRADRHRKLMESHERAKVDKRLEKQVNHLEALQKELVADEAEVKRRAIEKTDMAEEELKAQAHGQIKIKGAGGRFFETPEAIAKAEFGGSLRKIVPAVNPLADRMQSVFRQRLLEQKPVFNGEYMSKLKSQKKDKKRFRSKFADQDARDIALMR